MTERTLKAVVQCSPQPGTGILHPYPSPALPHLDPFVFLDTGAPKDLGTESIYVGPHPHRGVQPVSLLFRGHITHRDSLGNELAVGSGGIQWLISGAGALHEEILGGDEQGVFHMAQLWINMPAELKGSPPRHHGVGAENIPELTSLGDGSTLRLYGGSLDGQDGPAPTPTPMLVGHLILEADGSATIPVNTNWTAAATVVAGEVDTADGTEMGPGDTPVFNNNGDSVTFSSRTGGEALITFGEPIGEPIAMGGGFVMNTSEEIHQAFSDYEKGVMGRLAPSH